MLLSVPSVRSVVKRFATGEEAQRAEINLDGIDAIDQLPAAWLSNGPAAICLLRRALRSGEKDASAAHVGSARDGFWSTFALGLFLEPDTLSDIPRRGSWILEGSLIRCSPCLCVSVV